jgi:hypothetical protein
MLTCSSIAATNIAALSQHACLFILFVDSWTMPAPLVVAQSMGVRTEQPLQADFEAFFVGVNQATQINGATWYGLGLSNCIIQIRTKGTKENRECPDVCVCVCWHR